MMRLDKTKVAFLMAKSGMFQKDLAEKIGMSRGNLSTLLNGKSCQARTALKISDALNVDVDDILEK